MFGPVRSAATGWVAVTVGCYSWLGPTAGPWISVLGGAVGLAGIVLLVRGTFRLDARARSTVERVGPLAVAGFFVAALGAGQIAVGASAAPSMVSPGMETVAILATSLTVATLVATLAAYLADWTGLGGAAGRNGKRATTEAADEESRSDPAYPGERPAGDGDRSPEAAESRTGSGQTERESAADPAFDS